MAGPGFIIYISKIGGEFLNLLFIDGNAPVISGCIMVVPFVQFIAEFFLGIQANADLVEEWAESIGFEKLFVIRRIIVHTIQRFLKAFGNQSPPPVAFAEV